MERLNNALIAKSLMEAGIEKIALSEKQIIDLRKEQLDLQKKISQDEKILSDRSSDKFGARQLNAGYFGVVAKSLEQEKKQMQDLNKQLIAVELERDEFVKIVNEEALKAGALALNVPQKVKEKQHKDNSLKNENDLTQEIYDEYIKRIQIAAEAQKMISDDETKSLEERLMAYRQYAELSFDAETVRGVEELEVINNNLPAHPTLPSLIIIHL